MGQWNVTESVGLVLLTAAEPKTGMERCGVWGVWRRRRRWRQVAPQLFAMRPLPFPVMKQLWALPKEEDGLFKPEHLTQCRQESSWDGQEFTQCFNGCIPLCSADWLKQRLNFFLWDCGSRKGLGLWVSTHQLLAGPGPPSPAPHSPHTVVFERNHQGCWAQLWDHSWTVVPLSGASLASFSILPASGQVLLENSIFICCYTEKNYEIFTWGIWLILIIICYKITPFIWSSGSFIITR